MIRDVFSKEAKIILPLISAILLSVTANSSSLYMFVFFVLVPLFYRVRQIKTFKEYFVMLVLYFLVANFFQFTFLIEVSEILPRSMKSAKVIIIIATILLSVYVTILNIIPMLIFVKVRTGRLIDIFTFSFLYILSEWFCENCIPMNFPWVRLGTVITPFYTFLQSASVFGGLFISLIILIINGLIANAFCSLNSRKMQYSCFFAAAIVFFANSVFGLARTAFFEYEGNKANVMLLQANIGVSEKEDINSLESLELHYELASSNIKEQNRPSIIVMPETAVNTSLTENAEARNALSRFAENLKVSIITGAFYSENTDGETKTYNAMYAVSRNGEIGKPYLKKILVPFGEFIPFENTLRKIAPSIVDAIRSSGSLSSSDEQINISLEYGEVSGMICLESIYTNTVRKLCRDGGDLIAVVANDAWFGDSYQLYSHFRHSIMRSVECGKYLINSANTGVSAIISPLGKITAYIEPNTRGVVQGNVLFIERNTLYTLWGDIIILPGAAVLVIGLIKLASDFMKKRSLKKDKE